MGIIVFLLVGGVAGWLAGKIMKGRGFGILGNIVVGVLGGILGGWLFSALGIGIGIGLANQILTALIGAVMLLFLIGLIRKA